MSEPGEGYNPVIEQKDFLGDKDFEKVTLKQSSPEGNVFITKLGLETKMPGKIINLDDILAGQADKNFREGNPNQIYLQTASGTVYDLFIPERAIGDTTKPEWKMRASSESDLSVAITHPSQLQIGQPFQADYALPSGGIERRTTSPIQKATIVYGTIGRKGDRETDIQQQFTQRSAAAKTT